MTYDRADWHYGGEYPDDLPPENGATHIGMFLGWAIKRGLVGEFHLEESMESVEAVREGRMDGRQFLMDECDEKFWNEDLSDEGNAFAASYYDEQYIDDYMDAIDDPDSEAVYHFANSPENQAKVEAVLDKRLAAWRREQRGGSTSAPAESPVVERPPAAPPLPPPPPPRPVPAEEIEPATPHPKKPWWRFW